MSYNDLLAGYQNDSPTSPIQLFAGDRQRLTAPDTIVSGAGVIAAFTVLGRIAASGKLTAWTPGASNGSEKACAVNLFAVDASAADKPAEVYVQADFNTNALVWPGGVTAAQKAYAFDGSKLSHRPLGYSG